MKKPCAIAIVGNYGTAPEAAYRGPYLVVIGIVPSGRTACDPAGNRPLWLHPGMLFRLHPSGKRRSPARRKAIRKRRLPALPCRRRQRQPPGDRPGPAGTRYPSDGCRLLDPETRPCDARFPLHRGSDRLPGQCDLRRIPQDGDSRRPHTPGRTLHRRHSPRGRLPAKSAAAATGC